MTDYQLRIIKYTIMYNIDVKYCKITLTQTNHTEAKWFLYHARSVYRFLMTVFKHLTWGGRVQTVNPQCWPPAC